MTIAAPKLPVVIPIIARESRGQGRNRSGAQEPQIEERKSVIVCSLGPAISSSLHIGTRPKYIMTVQLVSEEQTQGELR